MLAGSRVQAAAKVMEAAANQGSAGVSHQLDSVSSSLRHMFAQQHQAIDRNLDANMQQLGGSLQVRHAVLALSCQVSTVLGPKER